MADLRLDYGKMRHTRWVGRYGNEARRCVWVYTYGGQAHGGQAIGSLVSLRETHGNNWVADEQLSRSLDASIEAKSLPEAVRLVEKAYEQNGWNIK